MPEGSRHKKLYEDLKELKASVRAKVEHPFRAIFCRA
jgi:hypothetical protein